MRADEQRRSEPDTGRAGVILLGSSPEPAPSHLRERRHGTRLDTKPAMHDRSPSGAPAARSARVLVADDQPDIIAALRLALKSAGFEAASAASIEEITRQVDATEFDLLLMDLNYARYTTSGA